VTGSPDNVAHLIGRAGLQLVRADVSDYLAIPGPVDYVLHFDSLVCPIDYAELPIQTLNAQISGLLPWMIRSP
jgi:hypothetical protein